MPTKLRFSVQWKEEAIYSMIEKEDIIKELKQVIDPELHINIVDLGLVYDVEINQENGSVKITMTLTTPGCPLSFVFEEWVPAAAKKVEGVKDVSINLVWEPPWDPDKLTDDAKEMLGIIR
jgi:metal-sulfur cluster biosynthetic enzyme